VKKKTDFTVICETCSFCCRCECMKNAWWTVITGTWWKVTWKLKCTKQVKYLLY